VRRAGEVVNCGPCSASATPSSPTSPNRALSLYTLAVRDNTL
jgi:hypothetical protein